MEATYFNEFLIWCITHNCTSVLGIAKKLVDVFFTGNVAQELENEIFDAEMDLNNSLRRLNKLNGKEKQERDRIVYYAGIVTALKTVIRNFIYVT